MLPLRLVLLSTLLLTPPLAAAGDNDPGTIEQLRAQRQRQLDLQFSHLIPLGKHNLSEVLRFRLDHGVLNVETDLPPTPPASIEIPQLPGLTLVQIHVFAIPPGQKTALTMDLEHFDLKLPDVVEEHTMVQFLPQRLILSQDTTSGQERIVQFVQLGGYESNVRLYLQTLDHRTGKMLSREAFDADTFDLLRRKYPGPVAAYLQPIFRSLGQETTVFRVDSRMAWQVLADAWTADPAVLAKVQALVAQFDADNFRKRQAASDAMAQLGEPAALALMRSDRTGLSAEQQSRIDAFLAPYRPLSGPELARSESDPEVLMDILCADDPVLRAAALVRLQKILGRTVDFDLNAPTEARFAAVADLRIKIHPTTLPTIEP